MKSKKDKKFKIMSCMFFGGTVCVKRNLSLEEARKRLPGGDVYEEFYILPEEFPDNQAYDYGHRIY